ncbi:MAG: phosphate ABC transporter permease PstA, partial [Acidimicrobiales bacterium]
MTATTLSQPIKAAGFRRISIGRRIKNNVATTLFLTSFVIALIPLVWLLWV